MSTQTVVSANKYSLSSYDWLKGLIVAVITPVFTIIMNSLNAGELTFNWKAIGTTALAALLAYILKNFFDAPKIVVTGASPEMVKAVKDGEADVKVNDVIAELKTK